MPRPVEVRGGPHALYTLVGMTKPRLTILGVYRPLISKETWQRQLNITGDEAYTKEHFDKLVLIEAVVEGLDGRFAMREFGQMDKNYPDNPRRMQVGYDEGLLSADGEALIQRRRCVEGTGTLRFAVYLHLYDPERPLKWQGGEVVCPPVQDVPARLAMLMPYHVI